MIDSNLGGLKCVTVGVDLKETRLGGFMSRGNKARLKCGCVVHG